MTNVLLYQQQIFVKLPDFGQKNQTDKLLKLNSCRNKNVKELFSATELKFCRIHETSFLPSTLKGCVSMCPVENALIKAKLDHNKHQSSVVSLAAESHS